MKIAIIIPAHNEEKALPLVLEEIPRPPQWEVEVIVVDNRSTDRTAEVARRGGADRVVYESKAGYGAACLRGLKHMGKDTEVVVILDGDHSDYPQDLFKIIEPIEKGEADFVMGSRTLGKAAEGSLGWNQRWGNRLACWLFKILYGAEFSDMGPFRALRKEEFFRLNLQDRDYGWNAEMQAKALIEGLRIREVPVRYRHRIGTSKISGTLKGTLHAGIKIIGRILFHWPRWLTKSN